MSLSSKKIVIAGGSGFLGVSLARHLEKLGADVTILSRNRPGTARASSFASWDGHSLGDWVRVIDGADGLVNLAGRTVDCIKSPDHCDEILRSRIDSTRVLGKALESVAAPPPVWVQMSTAHIYGDPPNQICDESSAFGYGLAPDVGRAWEAAFEQAALPNQRKVCLRTSFVIGNDLGAGAGAMARLRRITKLGLGGRVGSGMQGMSWIHELDMNRIFERALSNPEMEGAYIASAPNPLPQHEFMRSLRHAMKARIGLPATEWMVRIGARLFLRTDPDLALYGRFVMPRRLTQEGFEFHFPELGAALADLESV
jgi:uncharacterized protein (TIGR01777 family)